MSELEKQIEELKIKDSHNKLMAEKLCDIKHTAFCNEWKDCWNYYVSIDKATPEIFKQILIIFPATEQNHTITSSSQKDKTIDSPFRINLKNPPVVNNSQYYCLEVEYMSDNLEVNVEIPIEFIQDFINISERHLSDSEYHYFIGVPHTALINMKIRSYVFKQNHDVINWYGGNKTQLNVKVIESIIDHLKK